MTTTERSLPLCVDLDGTLIATDLLWESTFTLIRTRPMEAALMPIWLLKGRANLKARIGERVGVDARLLPYRAEVVDYLRGERARGRWLVLATAADRRLAEAVAEHLDVFDEVVASDDGRNLKGREKLAALQARFGAGGFDYLGDSRADLPIWEAANKALIVRTDRSIERRAAAVCSPSLIFDGAGGGPKALVKALRPHQWAKNVLVFVALIAAHQVFHLGPLLKCGMAFLAFSFTASAVYILNDLLDLESDRRHPRKRRRPFASGAASIPAGVGLIVALLGAATAAAAFLPPSFIGLLILYLALTTAYSVYLKRKLMVDVLCLAGLYTLRILAGGAAASIVISPWLMAFSMFFFLSLAFAKRYTELTAAEGSLEKIPGRGYWPMDLELIRSVGPTSGYLCVLVFCLYLNSPDVRTHYGRPEVLWLSCPLLLYWISRIWFLAYREQLDDDPVAFALRDRISYLIGGAMMVVLGASL
ncbi:UbiA family prenyltransferase [Paludisphaera borealis]|nr:UbiA family prenyltransferase [Paludisphaera borealis]